MQNSRWSVQIQQAVRSYDELTRRTGIRQPGSRDTEAAVRDFPVRVPDAFIQRIAAGDPGDPLLRQVLPVDEESRIQPGYVDDPLGETDRHRSPGLIQKYHGRALLITTSACAVHCRYCFRRHYPYTDNRAARDNWAAALECLRGDNSIREIILSGGDPLTLTDTRLAGLIRSLDGIEHLKWLRIHTRLPVVVPDRVSAGLVKLLRDIRMQTTMVIHANHPNEIDRQVSIGLEKLHVAGIQLLNQSVLLRGVNDDGLVLAGLSERLYASHVLPYYLHMLDPVAGAAHFEVSESDALGIMRALRSRLPGYLVPRLVREIDGEPGKTILA